MPESGDGVTVVGVLLSNVTRSLGGVPVKMGSFMASFLDVAITRAASVEPIMLSCANRGNAKDSKATSILS